MALTNTIVSSTIIGNKRMVLVKCQFDNSYATGGYSFAPADVGLSTFDIVLPESSDGYMVRFDRTTSKLKVRTPTIAAAAHTHTGAAHTHTGAAHTHVTEQAASYTQNEVSASTTPGASGSTTPGAGSSAGAITAAQAAEVGSATDLSTVTACAVLVIGN